MNFRSLIFAKLISTIPNGVSELLNLDVGRDLLSKPLISANRYCHLLSVKGSSRKYRQILGEG